MLETIPEQIQQRVEALGAADVLVGIPSFENAATIGHVVRQVQEGLQRFFPGLKSVIVNSDGGSKDGTEEQVLKALPDDGALLQLPYPVHPVHKLSAPYSGVPGKSSAVHTVFELAQSLDAKACVIVEADVKSISPDWMNLLVRPVLEQGVDLVVPFYTRQKFEGTIVSGIVYPFTRALYGRRIRQPLDGEFCFSRHLVDRYLIADGWETETGRLATDTWLITEALCSAAKICQVALGAHKRGDPKDPAPDLSATLGQVVGALFSEMDRNAAQWQKVRGSEPTPVLGDAPAIAADPVQVDAAKMIESFRIGHTNLSELWSAVLPPATLLELRKLSRQPPAEFRLADDVWGRIIYDFAVGYHIRVISRDHLLAALTPLYLGWVASFVLEMQTAGAAQVEARLEKLCAAFEARKPYLISRWRWPDRFNP
jgi:glucosylglycerate synthase